MKIFFRKLIATILIAIASIIVWVFLVFVTTDGGTSRNFAPAWTGFAAIGGCLAIVYVWTTGWSDKSKDDESKNSNHKDIFKM